MKPKWKNQRLDLCCDGFNDWNHSLAWRYYPRQSLVSWLSNRQLVNVKVRRNADGKTWTAFCRVCPIDNLLKFIPHLPIFITVSTNTHNLPGTHLKYIFIDDDRRDEILDSLGQTFYDITARWMTRNWKSNNKCNQWSSSSTYTAFVLYFILLHVAAPYLETVTKVTKQPLYDNECLVRSF